MKTTKAILIFAGVLFFLFNPVSSKADTITFTNANSPLNTLPGPYGSVDITLVDSNTAKFTFNYGVSSGGAYTYLFVDGDAANVNINASSFTPSFVSATNVFNVSGNGFVAPAFDSFGSGQVDGFGNFNLTVKMADATHQASSQIIFTVDRTDGGTWASASDVLSGTMASAHVVAFSSGNVKNGQQLTSLVPPDGTGKVGTGVPVPEPGILILLGIAMSAIGIAYPFARKI